jgi:hypothetical protein
LRADDRPDDRDAVQHRLEDRQAHVVVGRQGDKDQPAAVGGVDVGVTQAGGLDLDKDLARAWLGRGTFSSVSGFVKSWTTAALIAAPPQVPSTATSTGTTLALQEGS